MRNLLILLFLGYVGRRIAEETGWMKSKTAPTGAGGASGAARSNANRSAASKSATAQADDASSKPATPS